MSTESEGGAVLRTSVHKLSLPAPSDTGPGSLINWSARMLALRGLTLIFLSEHNKGTVEDEHGFVPARFRERFGLTRGATSSVSDVWRLMEAEGIIERSLSPAGQPEPPKGQARRTYLVKLVGDAVSSDMLAKLHQAMPDMLTALGLSAAESTPPPEPVPNREADTPAGAEPPPVTTEHQQSALDSLGSEIEQLVERITMLKDDKSHLADQLTSLQAENAELRGRLAELHAQVAGLLSPHLRTKIQDALDS